MKNIIQQMTELAASKDIKRRKRIVYWFIFGIFALITIYSLIFIQAMAHEGRDYSIITGYYWTMTVMSTLGFGDVTFESDLGKLFTLLVLFSGIIIFMLILPFTFIRFVYQPWVDTYNKTKIPRYVPDEVSKHVLIVGTNDIAINLAKRLQSFDIPHFIMTDDFNKATVLFNTGMSVMHCNIDASSSYIDAGVMRAVMVVALCDDMKNTNIISTIHSIGANVIMASSINNEGSLEVMHLAGCEHIFNFVHLLGETIGRRVFYSEMRSNIIGRFESLCVAESPVHDTVLVGKTPSELNFREKLKLDIVGIWQGTEFHTTGPDTVIDASSVLMLSGTADRLEAYDRFVGFAQSRDLEEHVVVIGGGRVGSTVVRTLEKRSVPFILIDKDPAKVIPDNPRYIVGNAEDKEILNKAGIDSAHSIVITTHSDDLNIYLTIYCRKLRPEAQIIVRCNYSNNGEVMYQAGASLVISSSSLAGNVIINLLSPDKVYTLTEGLNIFRVKIPPALHGKSLRTSEIRNLTGCNVMAIQRKDEMLISPDIDEPFLSEDQLILIGSLKSELKFTKHFPPPHE